VWALHRHVREAGGKGMKLKASLLNRYGACEKQLDEFERIFPDGMELTLRNIRRAGRHGLSIYWIFEKFTRRNGKLHHVVPDYAYYIFCDNLNKGVSRAAWEAVKAMVKAGRKVLV
jgi:hypothetical protein